MLRPALPMLLLLALLTPGCTSPETPQNTTDDGGLTVFVSIPPQRFLVQRVAGDLVTVEVLLPAGQSPATYEPTPQQMNRLARSAALFRIGVPFEERLMSRIADAMPELRVVDTRQGIDLRVMEGSHNHGHGHDHGHGHEHGDHCNHAPGSPDPHIWLDPRLALVQARTIHDTLAELLPAETGTLRAGLDRLADDLLDLDRELTTVLEPLRGRSFYVFHPAYGYLADAYGLRQVAVELEGKEPSARQLAHLITRAREEQVTAIFHQPQFASSSVETLAREIGGTAVELDPLEEAYLENLRAMATEIGRALGPGETD